MFDAASENGGYPALVFGNTAAGKTYLTTRRSTLTVAPSLSAGEVLIPANVTGTASASVKADSALTTVFELSSYIPGVPPAATTGYNPAPLPLPCKRGAGSRRRRPAQGRRHRAGLPQRHKDRRKATTGPMPNTPPLPRCQTAGCPSLLHPRGRRQPRPLPTCFG